MIKTTTLFKKASKKTLFLTVIAFTLLHFSSFAQGEFKINVDISAGNFTFVGTNLGTDITVYDQANLGGPPLLTLTAVNSQTQINQSAFTDPSIDDVQIWYSNNITVINFNANGNVQRIQSIVEWGTATFTTLNFYNGINLDIDPGAGAPNIGVGADFLRMFRNCNSLVDAANTLGTWNTTNVTNMQEAFYDADGLVSSNLGNWDVGNVTNFQNMFGATTLFNDPTINNWNISENTGTTAITMESMFNNADGFNQTLNGWETNADSSMEYVSTMKNMFANANVFNGAIGAWDVGRVTSFNQMFYRSGGPTAFNNGDASGVIGTGMQNWNIGANLTTETISMYRMFREADQFNQDLSNWDVSKVTNFREMFLNTNLFTGAGLNSWTIGGTNTDPIDMNGMFYDANQFNEPLEGWETNPGSTMAYVTDMTNMFFSTGSFNQAIDNWNVGRVTSFNQMFYAATAFNNGDAAGVLGDGMQNWIIGINLTTENINMNRMFRQASVFNQDLSNWNVTKVNNFNEMFFQATAFTGDGKVEDDAGTETVVSGLSNWKISGSNTNPIIMTWMFGVCPNFNEPLATWETDAGSTMAYVTHLNSMFNQAVSFNHPLGDWNVGRVVHFGGTFANMNTFDDQAPSINTWNIGENTGATAIAMNSMFQNSNAFNSPLASWETNGDSSLEYVSNMSSMFMDADIFNQPLGAWDVGRVTTFSQMFYRYSGPTAFNNGDASGVVGTQMGNWDIGSNLTGTQTIDMYRMFRQSDHFNQNLGNWDVRRVYRFQEAFMQTDIFQGVGLSNWQISGSNTHVVTMQAMFASAFGFVEPLATWETGTGSTTGYVNNMRDMFNNTDNFDHPIGDWDVGRVTNFIYMFANDGGFTDTAPSINNWNIGQNTGTAGINMQGMFQANVAFNNPLEGWERASGTNGPSDPGSTMAYVTVLRDMFRSGAIFNNAINTWDVGRVGDFHAMFYQNSNFNQPVNNWNIGENRGNGINMQYVFGPASSFNQPVNNWDVSKVNNFYNMFGGATSFDQSLASWTPIIVTDFRNMLNNSGLSVANYDATLTSWAQQDLIDNRVLGATGLEFCAAEPFRGSLVSDQGWTIQGDALGCAPGNVSGSGVLKYWVTAGSVIESDGNPVSQWRDISGDGRHFNQTTVANQPTVLKNTTDMVNFNPIMQFDGADDYVEGFDFSALDPSFPNTPRINLPIAGRTASSELTIEVPPLGATPPNELTFSADRSVLGNTFNGNRSTAGSWRPATVPTPNANTTEYLELDLGEIVPLSTIRTQGEGSNQESAAWTETYTVEVSTDGTNFTQVDGTFTGNVNRSNTVLNEFSANTPAQYVRIYPQTWNGYPALRVGVGTKGYNELSTFVLAIEDVRQNNATQSVYHLDNDNRLDISVVDAAGNATVNNSFAGDNSVALSSAAPALNGNPFLINYSVSGTGEAKLYRNGVELDVDTTPAKYNLAGTTYLGGLPTSDYFNGKMAEANLLADVLTQQERERINTYFAIKYNIPLQHDFIYEDELTATVETVWDKTANATYDNDVFGLAKDDNQGLNQRVSSSLDADNVLIAATTNDFTNLNSDSGRLALTGTSAFVIMGNDDGATTFATAGAPSKYKVLNRKWFAQVTGSDQDLFLEFDVDNATFDIDPTEQTTDYYLVKDDNNNGNLSDDIPVILTNTSGSLWSTSSAVSMANGQLFTLGIAFTSYPGGVGNDLALWLKADAGTYNTGTTLAANNQTVETWVDQSVAINNFTAAAAQEAIFNENSVNFNPGLSFTSDDHFSISGEIYNPDASHEIYMVLSAQSGNVAWSELAGSTGKLLNIMGNYTNNNSSGSVSGAGLLPMVRINAARQVGLDVTTYQNGAPSNIGTHATTDLITVSSIGGQTIGGHDVVGDIQEFVAFSSDKTDVEKQKIESYLALKYGITLEQALADGTGIGDYLASDGSVVFEAHDGTNANPYNNDIFGIATDDTQALNQRISKSVNTGAIVTLSTDNNFATANATHSSLTDGQFLVIGNDGGAITLQTSELTSLYQERTAREWRVTNTGNVGAVNLKFEGFDDDYVLITTTAVDSGSGDFTTSVTTQGNLNADGEIAVTLPDGVYFTLAKLADNFITTWEVTATDLDITIPTTGTGYDYSIDWGDGTIETNQTGDATHTYANATGSPYTVSITGDFPRIYINGTGDKDQLQTIEQWGDIAWKSMDRAFRGATNLTYNATDIPNLSGVDSLNRMFDGATSFNGAIGNWDVSTIQDFSNVFLGATSFDQPIGTWSMSAATTIAGMFQNATSFNQDLTGWERAALTNGATDPGSTTQNITSMALTFANTDAFLGDMSTWSVSGVTSFFRFMLDNDAAYTTSLAGWERDPGTLFASDPGSTLSNVDVFQDMFRRASNFNSDVSNWEIGQITNSDGVRGPTLVLMFADAAAFNQDISGWDTDNVRDYQGTFNNASAFNQNLSTWGFEKANRMGSFLSNTGMSVANYDATLIGMLNQDFTVLEASPTGGTIGVDNLKFCLGESARQAVIDQGISFVNDSNGCPAIEFEVATATDVEALGGNLPKVLIEGTLVADTNIDILINATGTATAGSDFTLGGTTGDGALSVTVTIPSGNYTSATPVALSSLNLSSGGTINFAILEDTNTELSETINLSLANVQTGLVIKEVTGGSLIDNHIYTITDNDAPVLQIVKTQDGLENSNDVIFTVKLVNTAGTALTNTTGTAITGTLALTGTATNGTDYTDVTTFAIPNGVSSQAITVSVTDDSELELSETVIATISAPSLGSISATLNEATANIQDDDNTTITVSADADTDESVSSRAFTLTMNNTVPTDVEVTYVLTGSATNPDDYTDISAVTGTITIPAGSTSATIDLTVSNDNLVEQDETIIASLSAATNNSVVTADTTPVTLTILDDDEILVSIIADPDMDESVAQREFLVALDDIAAIDVVLDYVLSGTATSSEDFTDSNGGSITIPAGMTVASIGLDIIDDTLVEGNETVIASLSSALSEVTLTTASATMFINDNDACTVPISLAVTDIQISTVDIEWSMPVGVTVEGYEWVIFEAGANPSVDVAMISGITSSGITSVDNAGTLIKDTDYDYYVRAVCSSIANSVFAGPISFTTLPDNDDDGIPDDLDPDDDNDGTLDTEEGGANDDCDNDGLKDSFDPDPCTISVQDIATSVTPNGDGINDTWIIKGIENFPNSNVRVYNRSGNEVFDANGYQNDWGSNYNDNSTKLPPGSYYFVVDLRDGTVPIEGWLFINY